MLYILDKSTVPKKINSSLTASRVKVQSKSGHSICPFSGLTCSTFYHRYTYIRKKGNEK